MRLMEHGLILKTLQAVFFLTSIEFNLLLTDGASSGHFSRSKSIRDLLKYMNFLFF